MTFEELMAGIDKKAEDRRASERTLAKAAGMTIAEFDADTTAPDPLDTVQLGPHAFTPTRTGQPRGTIFRNCAICNNTVIAEECIYQRSATYVRGFVTCGQERVTLDRWHKVKVN